MNLKLIAFKRWLRFRQLVKIMTILKFFTFFVLILFYSYVENASQTPACVYSFDKKNNYECELTLNASDESTQISGKHWEGVGDENVTRLTSTAGKFSPASSTKILADLCKKFENLDIIFMIQVDLAEIDESWVKNCKNLYALGVLENKVRKLSANTFASQFKLGMLLLNGNHLEELDQNAFADLTSLTSLYMSRNRIQVLPDGIFAPLINLIHLMLGRNKLTTLDSAWFGDGLKKFYATKFFPKQCNNN